MEEESPTVRELKDYAKFMVGLYANLPNATKGIFWKVRLQTKIAMHWESSNIGIPQTIKETLGENVANELFKDATAEIISNNKLLKEAMESYGQR